MRSLQSHRCRLEMQKPGHLGQPQMWKPHCFPRWTWKIQNVRSPPPVRAARWSPRKRWDVLPQSWARASDTDQPEEWQGSLKSGKHSRWVERQVRLSSRKGRAGNVPKKQRDGNGIYEDGVRGLRPASELILGTLSSHLMCSLAHMLPWGLDRKYLELALHH